MGDFLNEKIQLNGDQLLIKGFLDGISATLRIGAS
jgi:hypothetical protein